MGRFLVLLFAFLISSFNFNILKAATISMYENGYPINDMLVEKVFAGKNIFTREPHLTILSYVRPCEAYPKNVYGDLYVCEATRSEIARFLKKPELNNLKGPDLAQWFLKSDSKIICNTPKADLQSYGGRNVYVFSGSLFYPTPKK